MRLPNRFLLMNHHKPITERTKEFAIRIVKACSFLSSQSDVSKILSRQLLRSGTSIGANCHEAQSAQSNKDFISKLEIALKEARETEYWLEILINTDLVPEPKFKSLLEESRELIAILAASIVKLKQK